MSKLSLLHVPKSARFILANKPAISKAQLIRELTLKGDFKLNKLAEDFKMNKAELVFIKVAQAVEDNRTYPISRAMLTNANINNLTLTGRIYRRAAQGRKNVGQEGITSSEKQLISKMKNDESGKTYPISRFMTSPVTAGVAAGTSGGTVAGMLSKAKGLKGGKLGLAVGAGALLGAGIGAAGTTLDRHIYSRAMLGRAKKGREGWTAKDKELLTQIRESEKQAQAGAFIKTVGKGLWGATKQFGKNIATDASAVKNTTKGMYNIGKKIGTTGKMTAGQEAGLELLKQKRNKALVGLAGRVGLPGAVAYNVIDD